MNHPHIIEFPKLGSTEIGYISVAENQRNVPFEIKRVFWSYHTPDNVVRGRHAHHQTEMVLVATLGRIIVNTEMPNAEGMQAIVDRIGSSFDVLVLLEMVEGDKVPILKSPIE